LLIDSAFDEDATAAAAKMNGTELEGRKLVVTVTDPEYHQPAKAAKAEAQAAAAAEAAAAAGSKAAGTSASAAAVATADASGALKSSAGTKSSTAAPAPAGKLAASAEPSSRSTGAKRPRPADDAAAAELEEDGDEADTSNDEDAAEGSGTPAAKRVAGAAPVYQAAPPGTLGFRQCQLVLYGLPADYDKKRLWKRVRKTTGATNLAWPVAVPGNAGLVAAYITYDRKVRASCCHTAYGLTLD
jgi:hypothetical protein